MAVGQDLARAVILPARHLDDPFQAFIQRTAQGRFIEIGRQDLPLADHVLQAQGDRAHVQSRSQFVDGRFQGEQPLSRTVTAISAGRNGIGIDAGIAEAEGFGCIV